MSSMVAMYREHSSHNREYLLYYCMVGRHLPDYYKVGKVPTVLLKPAMLLYGMDVPTRLRDRRDVPTRLLYGRDVLIRLLYGRDVLIRLLYGRDVPTRLLYGRDVPTRLLEGSTKLLDDTYCFMRW